MKYVVLVALSLLVGFLAGAMAKGKEIHEAHEQIAELEEKECRGGGMGRGIFDAMTQRRPSEALELDKSPSPPVEDDVPRDDGASKDDDVTFEFEFGSGKKGEGSRDDGF
ncbi:MAG: hypothetical protein HN348_29655, partial [Proteobacteria bacterium]|nr:hypothetical protein [Pseudomonadota bacterium]